MGDTDVSDAAPNEAEPVPPTEVVRRFDTGRKIKEARKIGIKYDPTLGNGIPATSTDVEPVDPDEIKRITGARGADEFIDIDISGKQVLRRNTKAGNKEIVIQEDVLPDDIVGSGKVRRSRLSTR